MQHGDHVHLGLESKWPGFFTSQAALSRMSGDILPSRSSQVSSNSGFQRERHPGRSRLRFMLLLLLQYLQFNIDVIGEAYAIRVVLLDLLCHDAFIRSRQHKAVIV